ncbi:MAG TPA: Gfo/Idh/MocA family oxidoreductase [Acidimicrobiia bacterium]|nr:Gfo/Idh/MocA family oxidoreductase [Acidimicrobiia bacterium]
MTTSLGAAVVGTGFGARVHVPALRAAGFDVVALVGRDAERTSRRATRVGVDHACTSLAEALALPGVDAVTISAPPAHHAPLAHEAIDAGRHVICEKPFTLDVGEASALVDAVERAGVVHALGHELRWFPERVAVAQAIRDGAIGDARLVSIVDFVPLLGDPQIRMPAWFYDASAGGGWFGASGSHAIDMLRLWLGDFASVSAATSIMRGDERGDADDSFTLQFRLRSGAQGVVQQSGAAWASAGQTVVSGTAGTLRVQSGQVWLANADGGRAIHPVEAPAAAPAGAKPTQLESMTSYETPAYTRLCEAFARAIHGEPPAGDVPLPTFHDGLAAMRVMDAARASAAAGGTRVEVGA